MANFYVGQRVRIVRPYPRPPKETYGAHPSCFMGCQATVRGTVSQPNAGFTTAGGCDYSVQPDGAPWCGMLFGSMLEPIIPPHEAGQWSVIEALMPSLRDMRELA